MAAHYTTIPGPTIILLCLICTHVILGFQFSAPQPIHATLEGLHSRTTTLWSSSPPPQSDKTQPIRLRNATYWESAIRGPPKDTKPDYDNIVGPLGRIVDRLFLTVFRNALAEQTQLDSDFAVDDYRGITDIALQMNRKYPNRIQVQDRALQVLKSLFPSWLPSAYARLFATPFPDFSARMNAWATKVAGTWLMGDCEINDIVVVTDKDDHAGDQVVGKNQGLLVKRCRFLEESGCASVCVNSCKIPTQTFFLQEMGLPLTMEPNYETFECQFSFGKMPNAVEELEAKNVPCLMRCPTAGSIRRQHSTSSVAPVSAGKVADNTGKEPTSMRPCELMENGTASR